MKKILFAAFFFAAFQTISTAQFVKFGIKAGLTTTSIKADSLSILNPDSAHNLGLAIKNAKNGFQFGVYTKIGKGIFVQPEIIFNSNSVDYTLTDVNGSQLKNEKYQYLDVPILLGVKLGPLRLQGGPVGHYFLNSTSELFQIAGYKQAFKKMTYGGQLGFGLNLGKHFNIDLRWETNLSKFGNHIEFFGNSYAFDDKPSRFLATVGWTF